VLKSVLRHDLYKLKGTVSTPPSLKWITPFFQIQARSLCWPPSCCQTTTFGLPDVVACFLLE
jgi:hypothetical protein